MALRVIMLGNKEQMSADRQMLRDRGFNVYTCEHEDVMADIIREVKPDVLFISPEINVWHYTFDYGSFLNIPVVYSLLEDDVYLVTEKHRERNDVRYLASDNVVDAIKLVLGSKSAQKKPLPMIAPLRADSRVMYRA